MSRKYEFMDEQMITEMDELLRGEHGKAITAFGLECGWAALKGYKKGCCIQSTLLGAGGVLLIFGAVGVGKKIIDKCEKKKLNEPKKYIEVDS